MMAKDTFLNRKLTLNSKGRVIDLTKPIVMAILNLTPDSFYSNSRTQDIEIALKKVADFSAAGATIIDLGAYSSRPGATDISSDEELNRLIPIVEAIVKEHPTVLISIDTFRASVAEVAVNTGAHLINDISGGTLDENMFTTIAKLQVPYIMMHMRGTPQNMQDHTDYEDIVAEVINFMEEQLTKLHLLDVNNIIIDPGFGFAKTLSHNYQLLNQLEKFTNLKLPVMVGFSRKSMISKVLATNAAGALNGTTILHTVALMKGASILRVHDVKEATECIKLIEKINNPYF